MCSVWVAEWCAVHWSVVLGVLSALGGVLGVQSGVLGGTWVYTDEVGTDSRHGLPIHSLSQH